MYGPTTQPSFEHMENNGYKKEFEEIQSSPLCQKPNRVQPLCDSKTLGGPNKQNDNTNITIKNKPIKTKKKKMKRNASYENSIDDDDKKEKVTNNGLGDEFALIRGPRRLQPLSNYPNRDTLKNILGKVNDECILPTTIGSNKGSFDNSGYYSEITSDERKNSKTKRVSNSSLDEPVTNVAKNENNRKTSKTLDISTRNTDLDASESPEKNDRSEARISLDSKEILDINSSNSRRNDNRTKSPRKTKKLKSPRRRSSVQSLNSLRAQSPYHQSVDLTKKNKTRKRSTDSSSSRRISRSSMTSLTNPLESSIQTEKIDENCEKTSLKCSRNSLRVLVNPVKDLDENGEIENVSEQKKAKKPTHSQKEIASESPTSNETFLDNNNDIDPFRIEQIDQSSSSSKKGNIFSTPSRSNSINDDDNFDNDDVFITDAPLSTFFLKYSENPVEVVCRYCRITVTSQIETESKSTIYLTSCLIFCFAGILNCCFTPCCMPSFRNLRHKCPICYTILGSFKSPMKTRLDDRLLTNIVSLDLNRPSIDSKSDLINRKL